MLLTSDFVEINHTETNINVIAKKTIALYVKKGVLLQHSSGWSSWCALTLSPQGFIMKTGLKGKCPLVGNGRVMPAGTHAVRV